MNLAADILAQRSLLDYLPPDTKLIKAGDDKYRCRCPLTDGDSNAFAIRRSDRGHFVFRCFSCGEHGTVIDLYAKLNHCSIREAIVALSVGTPRMTIDAELQRASDAIKKKYGAYTLACDAPCCESVKQVPSELDAVIIMSNGSNWEVAPDGIGALCPRHA